jgi:hypothetical protein
LHFQQLGYNGCQRYDCLVIEEAYFDIHIHSYHFFDGAVDQLFGFSIRQSVIGRLSCLLTENEASFLAHEHELQKKIDRARPIDAELDSDQDVILTLKEVLSTQKDVEKMLICFRHKIKVDVSVFKHLHLDAEAGRRDEAMSVHAGLDRLEHDHRIVHLERFEHSRIRKFEIGL